MGKLKNKIIQKIKMSDSRVNLLAAAVEKVTL
jgi:hypothetical protein